VPLRCVVLSYLANPLVWVAILWGTGTIFVAVEVVLQARHLRKVDDLANALHEDLLSAEAEIAELRVRLRLPLKPITRTQPYGRHAHKG